MTLAASDLALLRATPPTPARLEPSVAADTWTSRARDSSPGPPGDARLALLLPWVLVVLAGAVVLADVSTPGLRPAAGLALLAVPVWVIGRRLPREHTSASVAWVLGLGTSVLGVIVVGLVLNTVLPPLGVSRPLDGLPPAVAVVVADVALLCWRPRVPLLGTALLTAPGIDVLERFVDVRLRVVPALAVVAVGGAVVGAVRLNNGAGPAVAVVGHVAVAALVAAVLLARTADLRRDAVAVYAAGLSLLLATSLRSWYVSGHDVQREFISFQLTADAGRWSMADYQSAYHACLSVNILPTILAELTGLSGAVVFKLVLQLVAAALPLVVLLLARLVVDRRLALAAAGIFIAFPTFSSDLPFLVRQEIAFLFFGLALLVAAQSRWRVRTRRVVVVVLGVGVVLSHYSTTYLTIATLLLGVATLHATSWWERRRDARRGTAGEATTREPLVLLHAGVLAALVAATWLWVSPATGSGGHLVETASEAVSNLLDGGGGPASTDTSLSILPGQQVTAQERLDLFTEDALERRVADTEREYLFPLDDPMLDLSVVEPRSEALTPLGTVLERVVPVDAVNGLLRAGSAFALQALVLVGLGAVALRRACGLRPGGLLDGPRGEQTRAVMIGSLGGLAMVVLVPGLSAEYGVLRAFQQSLVLLAPVVVIGALTVLGVLGPLARWSVGILSAGVVALLLVLTGVVSTLTGGYTGLLALSDEGPYVQLHYLTDAEVAGYRWLGENAGGRIVQAEVISDKLAANRLRYYPEGGVLVASDVFPASLLRGSVVFLGSDTVRDGVAAEFYTGTVFDYRFPARRLERQLDVVYSSPDARIFW